MIRAMSLNFYWRWKNSTVSAVRALRRAVRGDGFVRIASSRIANWVRNKMSGENVTDAGCCYRAFKRECIADLKFFKGMHRFLPTLFKIEGFTVTEIPVRHNPRTAGISHLRRVEPPVCIVL